MALGQIVYTDKQREAMAVAYADRGIKPKRIVEMAAAGELTLDGDTLEPFTTNENTVRDRARILRRRRAGKIQGSIAKLPPRDALEVLRSRLVNAAEQELAAQERRPRGRRDIERLRQIGRLLREAAALPLPTDPRPAAPGQMDAPTGEHHDGRTTGGMASSILDAARVSTRKGTAPQTPTETHTPQAGDVDVPRPGTESGEQRERDAAGSWVGEQLGQGEAELAGVGSGA